MILKKKIHLGVAEFALPSPKEGSIDTYSGFFTEPLSGSEIHKKIQIKKITDHKNYKAEVAISHQFTIDKFIFKVSGRMDGIFEDDTDRIEEIKTSFNVFELYRYIRKYQAVHPYCLQLKTYGYFHWLKTKKIPELNLHLVSSRNLQTIDLPILLDIKEYETWLERRLSELANEARETEKTIKRRKQIVKNFQFPFVSPRKGQVELIEKVNESLSKEQPILLQAPTGLGKTIAVLYPMLKEALARGQKVIYVTPKNTQHAVAEDAVKHLQETGAKLKSLTLTAKSKLCLKAEPLCNSKYCEFAENHYTKISANELKTQLTKKRNLRAKTFTEMGKEFQVCPFELQFELIKHIDVIICDYNYVFAPRSSTGKIATNLLGEVSKPNLIIDEVHNLPTRGMDYYSPSLSVIIFENLLKVSERIVEAFREKAIRLIEECICIINEAGPRTAKSACIISPPTAKFIKHDSKLREFLANYLNSDVTIEAEDIIMRFTYYWSEFTKVLEFINLNRNEFFTTYHPYPPTIKITCCDAADMLQPCYADYKQVVGFSATLKPFDFYAQLLGLKSDNLQTAEFVSPFSTTNRKILIIPQVSTKYSERERNYSRIAEVIDKVTALKKGNYFVFFPSFEFLERTLAIFQFQTQYKLIQQKRKMNKSDVETVLNCLRSKEPHIIFAVQGGIFSEGVDYPGDMAIGAFIVGPPLPNFDLEQEKKREYYQARFAAGFEYAYVYPAMAKAVQAAGRVIRSETDKGIIVLLDNRFVNDMYANCMPRDWFQQNQNELISQRILQEISHFWEENEFASLNEVSENN